MTPAILVTLLALAAYVAGSIPFGFLIAKWWRGVDLRTLGSRNIGATNTGRVLGKSWGALCLLLDLLKGLLPTLLLPRLVELPAGWIGPTAVACGTAAILGHVFPVWLGFRGGKGVATGAGVAMVLSLPAGIAALAAFAIAFAIKRTVSLASIAAAVVYAVAVLAMNRDFRDESHWPLLAFAIAIPTLIIVRHRENIVRLLRGQEQRYLGGTDNISPNSASGSDLNDTQPGKSQSTL